MLTRSQCHINCAPPRYQTHFPTRRRLTATGPRTWLIVLSLSPICLPSAILNGDFQPSLHSPLPFGPPARSSRIHFLVRWWTALLFFSLFSSFPSLPYPAPPTYLPVSFHGYSTLRTSVARLFRHLPYLRYQGSPFEKRYVVISVHGLPCRAIA